MMNAIVAYFGYGSLVNRDTLATGFLGTYPARLKGWRRHWQSRGIDASGSHEIALLSVHRDESCSLDGMLVVDREAHIGRVDLREARYDRQRLSVDHIEFHAPFAPFDLPASIYVYIGKPASRTGAEQPKLLQSYLDTVMAGYLREFGETGLAGFIETTVGFDRSIICDRHKPAYARATPVSRELARRFDELLVQAGVQFC